MQHAGAGIVQDRFECCAGQGCHREIGTGNPAESRKRNRGHVTGACGRGSCRRCSGSCGSCGRGRGTLDSRRCNTGARRKHGAGVNSGPGERSCQIPHIRTADFHDNHIHYDFGARFVKIRNQLFHQRHGVRFRPHDERILAVIAEYFLHIHHRAQHGQHFLHFLRRSQVRQVKNLHYLLSILTALGGVVDGNKNGVGRKRFPEGFRHYRELVQCLVKRGTGQVNLHGTNGLVLIVFGIKQNIDASHFANRFEENARPVGHFQINEVVVERSQLRNRQQGL